MIQLLDLCKSFEDKEVLKHIDSTFEAGKTNLIIGQSGSGKTVLMKESRNLQRRIRMNGRRWKKATTKVSESGLQNLRCGMTNKSQAFPTALR